MAKIVLGIGTSHTPMLNTPVEDWPRFIERDRLRPHLTKDGRSVTYEELDRAMDRVAAALQRDGTKQRQAVASVAYPCVAQALVFLGALRAGSVAAPIQPSATPAQIAGMIADSGADIVFLDAANADALVGQDIAAKVVMLEELDHWLAPAGATPDPVEIAPEDGFNIIYSSGTTGIPKIGRAHV